MIKNLPMKNIRANETDPKKTTKNNKNNIKKQNKHNNEKTTMKIAVVSRIERRWQSKPVNLN